MSHFGYSLKSSEVTSRACLFTPHLPGTLSSSRNSLPAPARGSLRRRKGSSELSREFHSWPTALLPPAALLPLSVAVQLVRFPQEFDSVSNAGMGKKRPRDIPCVAAIWCLSPPPAVPPTHKFTHGWSWASSNALGITTQRQTDSASPGTRWSLSWNPKRSAGNPCL